MSIRETLCRMLELTGRFPVVSEFAADTYLEQRIIQAIGLCTRMPCRHLVWLFATS